MKVEWISVKDRLPEPWEDVLLFSDGRVFEGCMDKSGGFSNAREYEISNVTHWCPLPEPPGEEGDV